MAKEVPIQIKLPIDKVTGCSGREWARQQMIDAGIDPSNYIWSGKGDVLVITSGPNLDTTKGITARASSASVVINTSGITIRTDEETGE